MEESLEFLSKVFDLLVDGDVFDTRSNEPKAIVDFHHPKGLEVGLRGEVLIDGDGKVRLEVEMKANKRNQVLGEGKGWEKLAGILKNFCREF
jgi:hypothetical protein